MKALKDQLKDAKKLLGLRSSDKSDSKNAVKNQPNLSSKDYRTCPECGCTLRKGRYRKHLLKVHGHDIKRTSPMQQRVDKNTDKEESKQLAKCPTCTELVLKKNLKKHIRKAHKKKIARNRKNKKRVFSPPNFPKANKPSAEDAKKLREAINDGDLITDETIKRYVEDNPSKDEMGKFGVPQDKYRWGFYGSRSMEYDSWSKNDDSK